MSVRPVLRRLSVLFAAVVALTAAGSSQEWGKTRLVVVPGKSVGSINLGDRLSANTRSFLGKATLEEPAGKGYASGFSLWGKGDSRDLKRGLRLHFSDGKDTQKIVSIEVAGLRASTAEGLFLGQPATQIAKIYPDAQKDTNPITRGPEYVLPGLVVSVTDKNISQFLVEPSDQRAWRFIEFRVVPGKSVGPFELGKTIPPEVYRTLGEPTVKVAPGQTENSGLVRWSLPGGDPDRALEVVLHDGNHPRVINRIRVRGIKAITPQKVKIGDLASTVRSLYPEGKAGLNDATGAETWRVTGLNMVLQAGKLREMQVYRPSREH